MLEERPYFVYRIFWRLKLKCLRQVTFISLIRALVKFSLEILHSTHGFLLGTFLLPYLHSTAAPAQFEFESPSHKTSHPGPQICDLSALLESSQELIKMSGKSNKCFDCNVHITNKFYPICSFLVLII